MPPTLSLEDKIAVILDHEELTARRLARLVLDKPVPPLWMILMPIFFVFHAYRIKQYSSGLKDFADNYMISRRRALEVASRFEEHKDLDPALLIEELARSVPEDARPPYREMMALLIRHYRSLLEIQSTTLQSLIKTHYRTRTNYLLFCKNLNNAEDRLNQALLPKIEGDRQELDIIAEKMKRGVAELHRADADQFFQR